MKKNNQGRIIHWDAKKTGSKLGEPFRYDPTLRVVEVSVSAFKFICDKSSMKHLKRAYNDLGGL